MAGTLSPSDALALIRGGRAVLQVVGDHEEDPTLVVYAHEGMIWSQSIAGWSGGVLEPVCSIESDFLVEYPLSGVLTDAGPWAEVLAEHGYEHEYIH